jgi:CRP/FNR family cyclic AMP-dependent transcriptional regulator
VCLYRLIFMEIQNAARNCRGYAPGLPFCNLSDPLLDRVRSVTCHAVYPRSTRLFTEGQQPRGIFVLCMGQAKLSAFSRGGKAIITRFAQAGDVLGLSAVVSKRPYGATAEMMVDGQADFIPQPSLLQLMTDHTEFAVAVAELLSASYFPLHDALRSLGLATHPAERLAKLLLAWTSSVSPDTDTGDQAIRLPLTHEEIGQTIGATRETVSRLFCELRRKRLVRSEGSELAITNRPELEQIVQF